MKKWKKMKEMEENEITINEELLFNDLDNIAPIIEEEDYLHPEIGPDLDY